MSRKAVILSCDSSTSLSSSKPVRPRFGFRQSDSQADEPLALICAASKSFFKVSGTFTASPMTLQIICRLAADFVSLNLQIVSCWQFRQCTLMVMVMEEPHTIGAHRRQSTVPCSVDS